MIEYKSKRQRYDLIFSQLDAERNSFVPHWKDLSQYILPRRSRFNLSDVNKGDRRNDKIIDNTATLAARTLRSGMMSGITSPARPWFRLTTPDPDMAEFGPVKQWLTKVQDDMISSYIKSNLYQSLLTMYQDLGVFGTTAMLFEESLDGDIFYTEPYPIGSYWLAKDSKGNLTEPGRNKVCDFQNLINTISYIVKWLFGLSIPILVAMFAYSGILYMTPSPENRKLGSKMLWAGLKGLVIMLVAFFLVNEFLKWVISPSFTGTDTFLNLTK